MRRLRVTRKQSISFIALKNVQTRKMGVKIRDADVDEPVLSPTLAANEMVKQRRKEGKAVLHMGFGESPFPVPKLLQEALIQSVHRKDYVSSGGETELRQFVLDYYGKKTAIDVSQFDVIVAPGSKLILYAAQLAVPGDLLLPVPSWVSYSPQADLLQTKVINVPTKLDDNGMHISAEEISRIIHQARKDGLNPTKIILNYPNNPTGLTIAESELKEIAQVCVKEGILIISDEIYGFVHYDKSASYHSIAKYAPTHTIVTTGLSKHLSLGGWRVGIGLVPKAIKNMWLMLQSIASETWSCVPSPITQAVYQAYDGNAAVETHIQQCTDIHALVNNYISQGLKDAGCIATMAQGAFYNFPDFAPFQPGLKEKFQVETSKDLQMFLMKEYGLACLAGTGFGCPANELKVRLSGCDYNGAAALQAYAEEGQALNQGFIEKYCPRVVQSVAVFHDFAKRCKE